VLNVKGVTGELYIAHNARGREKRQRACQIRGFLW
jgi:hypothetical protein